MLFKLVIKELENNKYELECGHIVVFQSSGILHSTICEKCNPKEYNEMQESKYYWAKIHKSEDERKNWKNRMEQKYSKSLNNIEKQVEEDNKNRQFRKKFGFSDLPSCQCICGHHERFHLQPRDDDQAPFCLKLGCLCPTYTINNLEYLENKYRLEENWYN